MCDELESGFDSFDDVSDSFDDVSVDDFMDIWRSWEVEWPQLIVRCQIMRVRFKTL